MSRTALIAIGGNSLIRAGERGTIEEQTANAHATARALAAMVARGWRIVITHGNGPQVGAALLRSERAAGEVYTHPLDVCVATTQSEIGYLLQRAMEFELRQLGLTTPVITVLTQVRVDPADPAFAHPTKPIGPFYTKKEAEEKQRRLGWNIVEDSARGYRRVVPSPEPCEVFEQHIIHRLVDDGMIVIACGGGGIPVIEHEGHRVEGSEAVIDKDRASALLAAGLGADLFVISTDARQVYLDFKKATQRGLDRVTADELRRHFDDGQFPPGSMGPKVESALRFLRDGGKEVIITSYEHLVDALDGHDGTHVVPAEQASHARKES
ncbi:MAG: carbamate kinase [Bacteroidota bacterium]|jgi:carbamate kinase|nr:carbamate kinase [Bacteroidota bacterium]